MTVNKCDCHLTQWVKDQEYYKICILCHPSMLVQEEYDYKSIPEEEIVKVDYSKKEKE